MKKKLYIIIFSLLILLNLGNTKAAMFYEGNLSSDVVYVINKSTGTAVIEKNINKKRSPASITKIMTFIIAYEKSKDIDKTKVKATKEVLDLVDPESSGCELKDGEEFTILDLFHCMLICSSGDAAMVLANYAGGNVENFVNLMNEKAQSLRCTNTHFTNPDGFYNENQYTTAEDIYKITTYAMNIPGFLDIVAKSEYSLFGDERDPIVTTNKMIDPKRGGEYYLPYVKGIKTGYLEEAGRCLVSYAEKNNSTYICIVLGGPTTDEQGHSIEQNMAMVDTKNIYNWVFENLKTMKLYPKDFPVAETGLGLAWKHDTLLLFPKSDFYAVLPLEAKKEDIVIKVNAPESVDAPLHKGDVIGKADLFYKDQKIGAFDLVSSETFGKNYLLIILRFCNKILSSPIFMILFSLFILFTIFYILMMIRENKRRKSRNKIKRFPNVRKMK